MNINDYIKNDEVLNARHKFIESYCNQKGWDKNELTLSQILELRKQDGWANAITKGK